jgi:hypothetical protein
MQQRFYVPSALLVIALLTGCRGGERAHGSLAIEADRLRRSTTAWSCDTLEMNALKDRPPVIRRCQTADSVPLRLIVSDVHDTVIQIAEIWVVPSAQSTAVFDSLRKVLKLRLGVPSDSCWSGGVVIGEVWQRPDWSGTLSIDESREMVTYAATRRQQLCEDGVIGPA